MSNTETIDWDRQQAEVAVLRAVEILTDDHVARWAADKDHPHGLTRAGIAQAIMALRDAQRALARAKSGEAVS